MAEGAYIAAVWEHPTLCIAFFGVQFLTEEGQRLYEESGISDAVFPALQSAEGLLHNRPMMTEQGPVLMQYWRSHDDLQRFARELPHTDWWRWLVQNAGNGVTFYHEVYQLRTAEAIYEKGAIPVGPATFCAVEPVPSGQGKSNERQKRFADAQASSPT